MKLSKTVKVKVVQSCLTLCDPCPAPSIHEVLQARPLEWAALSSSIHTLLIYTIENQQGPKGEGIKQGLGSNTYTLLIYKTDNRQGPTVRSTGTLLSTV